MKNDAIIIAQHISEKVSTALSLREQAINEINEHAQHIGLFVLSEPDINNDYLKNMANSFGMDEIFYYTPSGETYYSATVP